MLSALLVCRASGKSPAARASAVAGLAVMALMLASCGQDSSSMAGHSDDDAATLRAQATEQPSASTTTTAKPSALKVRNGERLVNVAMPETGYAANSGGDTVDDYRCFLLDPGVDADSFITGTDVQPDNERIVHHAILYRVGPTEIAAAQELDANDDGLGWSCYGGTGLTNISGDALNAAPWLAAWAPGGKPAGVRDGTGIPLEKGSRVILQMHYNTINGTGDDRSTVVLRVADGESGLTPLKTMLLVAPVELPCPDGSTAGLCAREASLGDTITRFGAQSGFAVAGLQLLCNGDPMDPASGVTQSCDRRMAEPITIEAIGGHMHQLGASLSVDHTRAASGTTKTLLDIPIWDFDDQSAQRMKTPVKVAAGDTLTITCTHDATLRDKLPALADLPDRYVTWGEGTTDEMCLGVVLFSESSKG